MTVSENKAHKIAMAITGMKLLLGKQFHDKVGNFKILFHGIGPTEVTLRMMGQGPNTFIFRQYNIKGNHGG